MPESTAQKQVITKNNICYWELHNNTSFWSKAFITDLGYNPSLIETNLNFFLNQIIHQKDRSIFRDNFYNLVRHDVPFRQNILLLNSDGNYDEYVSKTTDEMEIDLKPGAKAVYFFKTKLKTHDKVKNDYYYKETATMTSTGSWYIDFENKSCYWDQITRKVLEYPEDFIPSLRMAPKLYAEEYKTIASNVFLNCAINGTPFDLEILMVKSTNKRFWARAIGKPVFNDEKEIIGIRGVFQDIDDVKNKEINLKRTSEIVASQNSRLFNFAHIVSHNLRSHSSNLALIVQLIESFDDPKEKLDLLSNVKDVSNSLNKTIEHLNEVVTIQTNCDQHQENISIGTTLNHVCKSISQIISTNNVTITSNFEAGDTISYIPAYMDSIILNILTNAIKYKHPDRESKIHLKTSKDFKNEDRLILEISDNGIGIDLEKFGDKLFGMYKTFHYNKDAVGIGLFITKNQIESLNGEIFVESIVNEGTTFTIKF
ncbi:ATP-binding protein [Psychroserpens sp. Hel_I_66]|uniref:ATP-binding protein n=1 Tax=Psychroserpens sp. Hel_I_66 TaxID=1250004 RepID=UPI0006470C0F|nr:ATP-binding protein [Psychroserpens sp. Hel_I_66]